MSVYQRPKHSGKWYVDIPARQSGTGRRERYAIPEARNRTHATRAEAKIRVEIFEGIYGRRASPQFAKFVGDVYLPWASQNKRSAMHDTYRAKTLCEFFKCKTLAEVSPLLIEKYKRWRAECATRTGGTVQPGTINNELALLSRIFSMAVDNGLMTHNPCSRVRRLRAESECWYILSREEDEKVMAELPEYPMRLIVQIAEGTGMRKGEVISLTSQQLDFGRGLVDVTNTKTGKPRKVPMSERVRSLLQRALKLRPADAPSDYLFPGPRKPWQHISGHAVWANFTAACARAGIEGRVRFHDLRHTAATRMAEGNAHLVDIKDVLGHSNIKQTARYAHATGAGMRRAIEAMAVTPGHNLVTSERFRVAGDGGK